MFDRAIGVIGVALTLLTAAAPSAGLDFPRWITPGGLALGILLTGISIGLVFAGGFKSKRQIADRALLRLRIFGDHRAPEMLDHLSIFRWYYLQNAVNGITAEGVTPLAYFATLFITFEPDVRIATLTIRSPDIALPPYDVREFNQRYAIIQFAQNLSAGTLEVSVA